MEEEHISAPTGYLRKLYIKGVRGIDEVDLEFPAPSIKGDPDIFVFGSKNGLGKTTILEAISLVYLCMNLFMRIDLGDEEKKYLPRYLFEHYIRAGEKEAIVDAIVDYPAFPDNLAIIKMKITEHEIVLSNHEGVQFIYSLTDKFQEKYEFMGLERLVGTNPEPMFFSNFMYLNSYRRVQKGNIKIGQLVSPDADIPFSVFKMTVLRAVMTQAGLFENVNDEGTENVLGVLNGLLKEFAGSHLGKLRQAADHTMEIRVAPLAGGPTYNFDGLSSGQKEIISTLFTIWMHTKDQPGLVLIDEPELHLNSEWHRRLIHQLCEIAPQNQYIIATHSEDVFAAVDPDRRLLLEADGGDPA